MGSYSDFLMQKVHAGSQHGFEPTYLPDTLFDFQKACVHWSVSQGRSALFEDCGLGKSFQQLVWAQNIVEHTNRPVLILTPLAVATQTVAEAEKFGIEAERSPAGSFAGKIVVSNYERLHHFSPHDFAGVVCDESSILKSFAGATKKEITAFLRKVPYRLLATATPSPNDYTELGTSSEALGYLGYTDMLNRFFKNDRNNTTSRRLYGKAVEWRFKGHAETAFWRWVCSWGRAIRKPSDLGFSDDGFKLPPLVEREHLVTVDHAPQGMLFRVPVSGLAAERSERRETLRERCEMVAKLVEHDEPALVWCHANDEGNLLEDLIPDAVQVSGSDSDSAKEGKLLGFASGESRVLITKPKIGAWGLNYQHCAHITVFPSHSFEQYYQSVRRCWRFGQKRSVTVDLITTEAEAGVMRNLQRKAQAAEEMFAQLVTFMNDAQSVSGLRTYTQTEEFPAWLSQPRF